MWVQQMTIRKRLLYTVAWLAICSAAGGIAAYGFQLSFWITFAITAAALVVNGFIAEWEDRMPGGFLNPRRKSGK
jgi:hypothetical protein